MHRHLMKPILAAVFAAVISMGSAQAFHKGETHGPPPGGGEVIQTLDSLDCADGEIPKYNFSLSIWECEPDDIDTTWGSLTGVPADIADGDDDAGTRCTAGQYLDGSGICTAVSTITPDTNAQTICGNDSSKYLLGDGTCASVLSGLGSDTVGSDELKDNSVGTEEVKNNSLTTDDLGPDSVDSSELATDSVKSDEIAFDTIEHFDIKTGAVRTQEVLDDDLTAADLEDEAGVEFSGGDHDTALSQAGPTTIRTITVTAPRPGFVIVFASGYFRFASSLSDGSQCSIRHDSTAIGSITFEAAENFESPESVVFMPFGATRGFSVSSGGHTFRLVCQELNGITFIRDTQLTAIYTPTRY